MIILISVLTCLNYIWAMYGLAYFASITIKIGVCLPALLIGAMLMTGIAKGVKDKDIQVNCNSLAYERLMHYGKFVLFPVLLLFNLWLGLLGAAFWLGNLGYYEAGDKVLQHFPMLGYDNSVTVGRLMVVADKAMSDENANRIIKSVTDIYGKDSPQLVGLYVGFGNRHYRLLDNIPAAKLWFQTAATEARKNNYKNVEIEALGQLARVFAEEKDWQAAVKLNKEALVLSQSLNRTETYRHVRLLRQQKTYYKFVGNSEELAVISNKLSEVETQRNQIKVFKMLCIMLPLIGFIFFIGNRADKVMRETWEKAAYEGTDLSAKVEGFNKLIDWEVSHGNLKDAELLSKRLMGLINSLK